MADDSRVADDFGGITGLFFGIGGGAPRPLLLFTGFTFAWRLLFCSKWKCVSVCVLVSVKRLDTYKWCTGDLSIYTCGNGRNTASTRNAYYWWRDRWWFNCSRCWLQNEEKTRIFIIFFTCKMFIRNARARTLFVLITWECPASLVAFDEVIVVGYWGCCRKLWPAGIDLAKPVAISYIWFVWFFQGNGQNKSWMSEMKAGVVAKMVWWH